MKFKDFLNVKYGDNHREDEEWEGKPPLREDQFLVTQGPWAGQHTVQIKPGRNKSDEEGYVDGPPFPDDGRFTIKDGPWAGHSYINLKTGRNRSDEEGYVDGPPFSEDGKFTIQSGPWAGHSYVNFSKFLAPGQDAPVPAPVKSPPKPNTGGKPDNLDAILDGERFPGRDQSPTVHITPVPYQDAPQQGNVPNTFTDPFLNDQRTTLANMQNRRNSINERIFYLERLGDKMQRTAEQSKELDSLKSARSDLDGYINRYSDDLKKRTSQRLETQGYSLTARPYEFNESAFENPYFNELLNKYERGLAQRQQVRVPTFNAATIDTSPQDQSRNFQLALSEQLYNQSLGLGPSAAVEAYKTAADRNLANTVATIASNRGDLSPLARRIVMQKASEQEQQLAAAVAQQRAQEQLTAQGQLASVASGMRTSDLSLAQNQAALAQEAERSNQAAELEGQRQLDAMTQFYLNAGYTLSQAQWAARMELETQRANQHIQAQSIARSIGAQNKGSSIWGKIAGGLKGVAEIGGAIATMGGSKIAEGVAGAAAGAAGAADAIEI